MTTQQETAHLSTLISRVHEEENSLGYTRKESLIAIAELILSGRYSKEEYSRAIQILAHYNLAKLANIHHSYRSTCWRLINAELAKPYKGRCARCGKPLTNPISLEFGHGPICRQKLGISTRKEV
jgi:hypothetical protein